MRTILSKREFSFHDQDPICDVVRPYMRGLDKDVAGRADLCTATVTNLRERKTRHPRNHTIEKLLFGAGKYRPIMDLPAGEHKKWEAIVAKRKAAKAEARRLKAQAKAKTKEKRKRK